MILKEFEIVLSKSILAVDQNSDIETGIEKNYLVNTGHKILDNPHGVIIVERLKEVL